MFPLDLKMQALKSSLVEVPKKWGKEYWVANCGEYCGKLLILNKGAESSYHYHGRKKETFYCLKGTVALTIEGRDYMLNPFARPKTILPNVRHQFIGITDAIILEISTHHDDRDVVRLTESRGVGYMEGDIYEWVRGLVPLFCVDLVVHKDNQILLCKRNNNPEKGTWALPGGRVLIWETLSQAVQRKAKEELGIEVKVEKQFSIYEGLFPQCNHHVIGIPFWVSPANDSPIQLDSQHSEYKWVDSPPRSLASCAKQIILNNGVWECLSTEKS